MTIVFWLCVCLIIYTYVGFPLLLALRAYLHRRPVLSGATAPRVSVIIAAHNEETHIEEKLRNVLALEYPHDKLEVIVASDGSTDGTDSIVNRFQGEVQLLSLPRGGKAAALNSAVAASSGDVLVFTDANSFFQPGSLRALLSPLADPQVGGVAGDQRYHTTIAGAVQDGERRYWDFDRQLKRWQSTSGSVTSATGAIYAIRRELVTTVPEGVTDDFAVSTQVIAKGKRLVFAEDAVALEPPAAAATAEFSRKVRIITRGLWGVIERRPLLNPLRYGFYSLQLFSHKVLRRLVALPLLVLLLASASLAGTSPFYQAALIAQLSFYLLAIVGCFVSCSSVGRKKCFSLPYFFCLVNLAALVAVGNVLRGRRIITWNPTSQHAPRRELVGAT